MAKSSDPAAAHLPRATELAHSLVSPFLQPGDLAVDATAGNGHDTSFLAERVGTGGLVIAIDLQEIAIESCRRRCSVHENVSYHVGGHEEIESLVPQSPQAILFNLGYLPSGDKSIITSPRTTIPALDASLRILNTGGILSVAVYSGHAGGAEEANAVSSWAKNLPSRTFLVSRHDFLNQEKTPPFLIAIEKRENASSTSEE
ncbi:MAG: class I SAM-dependent methyltransferase [Verrucomicrobiota bacterium]